MTFIKYEINFNEEELKGKTLVLPTISMANVPQLATELLLNNHSNELVGRFNNEGFIQVAGASTDGLVTPLELHRLKEYSDIYVVDQRSPILKSYKYTFVEELKKWADTLNLSVIILSSADSASRNDNDIVSSQLKQISSKDNKYANKISSFESLDLDTLNGTGLLKSYYGSLKSAAGLCLFTTEGDNRPDAHLLVKALSNVLGFKPIELKDPLHWEGLFGRLYDDKLFG